VFAEVTNVFPKLGLWVTWEFMKELTMRITILDHMVFPQPPKLGVYAGSITPDHDSKISRASRIGHLDRAVSKIVAILPEPKL
jgi:hypothetical protein